jgi:hypothetical protein
MPPAHLYNFYTGLRPFWFNTVYNYEREKDHHPGFQGGRSRVRDKYRKGK